MVGGINIYETLPLYCADQHVSILLLSPVNYC